MKKVQSEAARPRPPAALRRVLYVEDEDENWELAQLWLEGRYELLRARDARSTCEVVRAAGRTLHAILMDIQLSGSALDGIQLTRLLRGTLPPDELPADVGEVPVVQVPIYFVTAYGGRYQEDELRAAGGTRLLPKPVDFDSLAEVLDALPSPPGRGQG